MPLRTLIALALAGAPLAAAAAPPPACSILSVDEVNAIAADKATKMQVTKVGNPSECTFMNSKYGAVLMITLREVQYAAENELQYERENLEKIYRGKVKWLTGLGDNAFWMPINNQLILRKAKTLATVKFARGANQTEVDTSQIARMVESRLK